MQIANTPLKWTIPFANGDAGRVEVPATTADTTKASLTLGFPPLTRTPPASGGVAPSGEDFNGAMNQVARIAWWNMAGGPFPYDAAFAADTNINGYPQGAVVPAADLQGAWASTADNNAVNPDTVGTNWVPLTTYGVTALTGQTGGTTTLTPAQAMKRTLTVAGVLTSNLAVVVPDWTYDWSVTNLTTGAFTVTVKTAAGSGPIIPQTGTPTAVRGDGTNIVSAEYLRNELASPAAGEGTSLVSHSQDNSAFLARSVRSVLLDVVDVKNFGAFGDGASHPASASFATLAAAQVVYPQCTALTDEIDALAALKARDYLATGTETQGGTIWFPHGQYKLNRKLQFDSISSVTNYYIKGDGMLNTTLDFSGLPAATDGIYFNGGSQVGVSDIMVTGATSHGIVLNDQSGSFVSMATLRQVRVQNCGGDGIYSFQSYLVTLDEVFSTTNGGQGFNFAGNHTSIVSNKAYAKNNTGDGWGINGAAYIDINAQSDGNQRGYAISNVRGGVLRAPGSESNQAEGILLSSSNASAVGIITEYQDIHGLVIIGAHQIRNNTAGPLGNNANIAAIAADSRPISFTVIGCVDDVTSGDPSVALNGTGGPVRMTQIDCQFAGAVAVSGDAVIRNVSQGGNYCLLNKTANQSIANSTSTDVTWAGIVSGENTLGATATSTAVVIPAGVSRVMVSCGLKWTANGTGARYIGILKNGGGVRGLPQVREAAVGSGTQYMTASSTYPVAVVPGDTITASVIQDSGAALDLDASGIDSWFCVTAVS